MVCDVNRELTSDETTCPLPNLHLVQGTQATRSSRRKDSVDDREGTLCFTEGATRRSWTIVVQ